jgi:hypothetical protein
MLLAYKAVHPDNSSWNLYLEGTKKVKARGIINNFKKFLDRFS